MNTSRTGKHASIIFAEVEVDIKLQTAERELFCSQHRGESLRFWNDVGAKEGEAASMVMVNQGSADINVNTAILNAGVFARGNYLDASAGLTSSNGNRHVDATRSEERVRRNQMVEDTDISIEDTDLEK